MLWKPIKKKNQTNYELINVGHRRTPDGLDWTKHNKTLEEFLQTIFSQTNNLPVRQMEF